MCLKCLVVQKFCFLKYKLELSDGYKMKHVEDSLIETNKGNKVCVLLILITYGL